MKFVRLSAIAITLSFLAATCVFAQEKAPAVSIKVLTDKPDALYKKGEPVKFSVTFIEEDKAVPGKKLNYTLSGDGLETKSGIIETAGEASVLQAKLDNPGFILLNVSCDLDGRRINGLGGAGIDPLEIKAAVKEPDDFDKFWNDQKAELAKIPMNPKLEPVDVPEVNKGKIECFDVKIDCPGGMPVSGYFARPASAVKGSLPMIISYHGAGVRSSGKPLSYASQGMLALDINAHGIENGKPEEFYKELTSGKLKGYPYFNSDDKDKIYFKGLFLRVLRSLEFMKSQPEWDGKTLIVIGGSQGGAQSLAAAGLDKQITFCVAYVPAMCDHYGLLAKQQPGWPRFIKMKDGKPENADIAKTVYYYDAAVFAKKIKAEVLMTVGFIDTTCAPASVYSAYNNITSKKEMLNNPLSGHAVPKENSDYAWKKIMEHAGRMKTAK
jgi:cephalosporin-C deacetylase-like acetyl esterase